MNAPAAIAAPALIDPRQALSAAQAAGAAGARASAEHFTALLIEQVVGGLHRSAHLEQQRSFADESFESMLDQHLAQHLARADSFGLCEQIAGELGRPAAPLAEEKTKKLAVGP